MELLDRYLQAVRFWLPKTQKQDIIAELSEDLQSQIDEKEAASGRALSQDEQVEMLKRFGPPMMVAGRYLPPQQLMAVSMLTARLDPAGSPGPVARSRKCLVHSFSTIWFSTIGRGRASASLTDLAASLIL